MIFIEMDPNKILGCDMGISWDMGPIALRSEAYSRWLSQNPHLIAVETRLKDSHTSS